MIINISKKDLDEMLDFYNCGLLAHHDKGEQAEKDVPMLIAYIKQLENQVEALDRYIKSEF